MNERDAKFFRPLWIRLLVTGVVVVWCAVEVTLGHDQLWIGITAVGVVYCVWNFFLRFPKDLPATTAPADPSPPSSEPPRQP